MYHIGDLVSAKSTGERGTVVHIWDDTARVRFDDERIEDFPNMGTSLQWIESVPGPSAGGDVVHAAMLRHAVNAGAAVTALEVIRREAKTALAYQAGNADQDRATALSFIEKFSDDVLSSVLPA